MRVKDAWARVERLKNATAMSKPADQRNVVETYQDGEAWMLAHLAEFGLAGDGEVDELARVVDRNARASMHNLLSMDDAQLRAAAIVAGIGDESTPPAALVEVMRMFTMHSAGFSNGLALGLELGKR